MRELEYQQYQNQMNQQRPVHIKREDTQSLDQSIMHDKENTIIERLNEQMKLENRGKIDDHV